MKGTLIRAPDHLGDGVLALPALGALARAGPCRVVGPRWCADLYGHLPWAPVPEPARAVLLKPAFRAAWQARHIPERVGLAWDLRGPLLSRALRPQAGHRLDEYAAIAGLVGVAVSGLPALPPQAASLPALPPRFVLLLPLSASGATVSWPGHRPLADALTAAGQAVVFAAGPGEDEALARIAGQHACLPALPLGAVAAVACRAQAVVGNDSGLSHLAVAARRGAGLDPAAVQVVCGSTSAARTAPPGATVWTLNPALPCQPCYKKRCRVGGLPCLDLPVATLLGPLLERWT